MPTWAQLCELVHLRENDSNQRPHQARALPLTSRMTIRDLLASKGIVLPSPPKPGGAYEAVRLLDRTAYVAIQFPILDGKSLYRGRLGAEVTTEQGYEAARLCALNVLAQLDQLPGLDRLAGLNRVDAQMQTVEGWNDFPRVLDGASHLFLDALGDVGKHARTLYGVERLPGNAVIALTVTATIVPDSRDRAD